ncbi:glycosyltransferase family 2 protein [Pyramidobacter sp.]|uniref:glycosyltransferase family 2 protein n=1 Tax=Pyramidobacter sp. TaxID=1943581 RepID=UPI0033234D33
MKKPTPAPLNFRPKVSVIVPVFNTAPYLRQCLDSLTGQTLRDIEIICVDDGSTDESPDILREYEARKPHLKALFHECNRGLAQTRKTGAACSNGDYVMFLDSDDEFFLPRL